MCLLLCHKDIPAPLCNAQPTAPLEEALGASRDLLALGTAMPRAASPPYGPSSILSKPTLFPTIYFGISLCSP